MYSFYLDMYNKVILLLDGRPVATVKDMKGYPFIKQSILAEIEDEIASSTRFNRFMRTFKKYFVVLVFACIVFFVLFTLLGRKHF